MAGPMISIGQFRPLALAVAAVAMGLVFLSGERLLSALYVTYAKELSRSRHSAHASAAALHAQQRAPWSIEAYREQLHAGTGQSAQLTLVAARALRWAPSDPYLWAELARQLAIENSFGNAQARALRNIQELAPNSPQLHRINAWFGLRYWHRGSHEVRRHWLNSMRFVIKTQPRRYLKYLKKHGQVERLCWTAGAELNLAAWCDAQLRDPP